MVLYLNYKITFSLRKNTKLFSRNEMKQLKNGSNNHINGD